MASVANPTAHSLSARASFGISWKVQFEIWEPILGSTSTFLCDSSQNSDLHWDRDWDQVSNSVFGTALDSDLDPVADRFLNQIWIEFPF